MRMTYRQQQLTIADLQERLAYTEREMRLAWVKQAQRELDDCQAGVAAAEKAFAAASEFKQAVFRKKGLDKLVAPRVSGVAS